MLYFQCLCSGATSCCGSLEALLTLHRLCAEFPWIWVYGLNQQSQGKGRGLRIFEKVRMTKRTYIRTGCALSNNPRVNLTLNNVFTVSSMKLSSTVPALT
jgi:hypothetical protein